MNKFNEMYEHLNRAFCNLYDAKILIKESYKNDAETDFEEVLYMKIEKAMNTLNNLSCSLHDKIDRY